MPGDWQTRDGRKNDKIRRKKDIIGRAVTPGSFKNKNAAIRTQRVALHLLSDSDSHFFVSFVSCLLWFVLGVLQICFWSFSPVVFLVVRFLFL